MSPRRKIYFVIGAAVILILGFSYSVARLLFVVNRPTLGVTRGSKSQAQSQALGFYIGAYKPIKRWIALSDLSRIEVPDAWVEHLWKPKLTFFLRDTAEVSGGYYLYIPIHIEQSRHDRSVGWPFSFGLDLQKQDGEAVHRGAGYDFDSGFFVRLDKLPQRLSFAVTEKREPKSSWGDVVTVDND